jgi:hypothetical protein
MRRRKPDGGGTIHGRRRNEDVWHAVFNGFPTSSSRPGIWRSTDTAVWITETHGTDTGASGLLNRQTVPDAHRLGSYCSTTAASHTSDASHDFTGMLMQSACSSSRRRRLCPLTRLFGVISLGPEMPAWPEIRPER